MSLSWRSWDAETFACAKKENKPVLLNLYSSASLAGREMDSAYADPGLGELVPTRFVGLPGGPGAGGQREGLPYRADDWGLPQGQGLQACGPPEEVAGRVRPPVAVPAGPHLRGGEPVEGGHEARDGPEGIGLGQAGPGQAVDLATVAGGQDHPFGQEALLPEGLQSLQGPFRGKGQALPQLHRGLAEVPAHGHQKGIGRGAHRNKCSAERKRLTMVYEKSSRPKPVRDTSAFFLPPHPVRPGTRVRT